MGFITMKPDGIHYSLNAILSRNKTFNAVISAREAGKSTAAWNYIEKQREKGKTAIVIRRQINDITDVYIGDIENVINKFRGEDDRITLYFKRGAIKDGVVTIYTDKNMTEPFFRVVALSNPLSRIKSLMLPNLSTILFDEFICNTRMGEKYLTDEVFRFQEMFNTFQREAESLRVIFLGNPYSLYNPYFSWFGVPTDKLFPGNFITGANYCVEVYELTAELKAAILAKNPLYQFDDSYTRYAFDGRAINDDLIRIHPKQPDDYQLSHVFYIHGKYLGIFQITAKGLETIRPQSFSEWFWISILPEYKSTRRQVACINFNELIDGNKLISADDKKRFYFLKDCFRNRMILYKSIEESYLFEEIYQVI